MKKGVFLINCARGGLVNETDLADAIEKGIVAGAALDVFDKEPLDPNHPLLKLDQVICTPHLGASTEEAQENVALDVSRQIANFLKTGTIENALNVPSVSGDVLKVIGPYLVLAEKLGKLQGQLIGEAPSEVLVEYAGDVVHYPVAPMTIALLKGILGPILEDASVNSINAPHIAKERGIKVVESKVSESDNYSSQITVTLKSKNTSRLVAGALFGKHHPRIVRVDNYFLEAVPEGQILVILNKDQPGVVGNIGTLLAKNNINISRLQLGLDPKTKNATAFYNIEGNLPKSALDELAKVPGMLSVKLVNL